MKNIYNKKPNEYRIGENDTMYINPSKMPVREVALGDYDVAKLNMKDLSHANIISWPKKTIILSGTRGLKSPVLDWRRIENIYLNQDTDLSNVRNIILSDQVNVYIWDRHAENYTHFDGSSSLIYLKTHTKFNGALSIVAARSQAYWDSINNFGIQKGMTK